MATLEKPKKIKTKKSTNKINEVKFIAEESSENEAISLINKEKAATSTISEATKPTIDNINELVASTSATIDDIETKDCFIASVYEESSSVSKDNEPIVCSETKLADSESIDDDTTTPTAPPCADNIQTKGAVSTSNLVHYPQIERFQYEEAIAVVGYSPQKTRTNVFRLSGSQLQPLTQEQLYQYYCCSDLALVQQFEMEFLMNSLLESYDGDPLYEALKEYYHMQSKLTMNLYDVKKFCKEAKAAQEHIWVEVPITKTFTGRCGDNIELKESVTYNIIQVDGKSLEVAGSALTVMFDIISNSYISNFITTKIIKFRIDEMIDELICCPIKNLEGPLKLQSKLDSNELAIIAKLRRALSILFHFSRKLTPNKDFEEDLKCWFRKLISLHLHLATKEDHWFLLFVVCCLF